MAEHGKGARPAAKAPRPAAKAPEDRAAKSEEAIWRDVEASLGALRDVLDRRGDRQRAEILRLNDLIRQVRSDLAALKTDEIQSAHIPEATDELEAVVKATEHATHEIMDAAEAIDAMIAAGEADLNEKVTQQVTRIFEACTFQDITGQRVAKVVTALQMIEKKVADLLEMFGVEGQTRDTSPRDDTKKASKSEDLLSGPQLPENAKSQAEIDALFSSLD